MKSVFGPVMLLGSLFTRRRLELVVEAELLEVTLLLPSTSRRLVGFRVSSSELYPESSGELADLG
jgi:hypothetical protein